MSDNFEITFYYDVNPHVVIDLPGSCCAYPGEKPLYLIGFNVCLPENFHGYGWGCDICNIPHIGAIAALSEKAMADKATPLYYCKAGCYSSARGTVAELYEKLENGEIAFLNHHEEIHQIQKKFMKDENVFNLTDQAIEKFCVSPLIFSGFAHVEKDVLTLIGTNVADNFSTDVIESLIGYNIKEKQDVQFYQPSPKVRVKLIELGFKKTMRSIGAKQLEVYKL